MREIEIKFKVWNTLDKCYVNPKTSFFSQCLMRAINGSKYYDALQYSGLKDCNGVEIYEGDVVYLAGYGDYTAAFPFLGLYEAMGEGDIGAILGNIYENPELVEGDL